MKIRISLLILVAFIQYEGIAQSVSSVQDSIFLSITSNNQAFFEVPIQPGMTFYGMSRNYKVPIQALLDFNPKIQIDDIPIGTAISIPFQSIKNSLVSESTVGSNEIPVMYRVRPKENLYRISKVYLGMDIKIIMERNDLKRKSLLIDQEILIGYISNLATSKSVEKSTSAQLTPLQLNIDSIHTNYPKDSLQVEQIPVQAEIPFNSIQEMRTPFDIYLEQNKTIKQDRGVAFWDKSQYEKKNLYVLHTTARKNSLVEITNPMNGRKVYAKVVGNIPSTSYTSDIKMVVSPAVADSLRVLDSRFYISYRYIE